MIKCLAIVDDATHEAVAVVPEHTVGGDHLIRILDGICSRRGKPRMIRTDNVLRMEASTFYGNNHPARTAARLCAVNQRRQLRHHSGLPRS